TGVRMRHPASGVVSWPYPCGVQIAWKETVRASEGCPPVTAGMRSRGSRPRGKGADFASLADDPFGCEEDLLDGLGLRARCQGGGRARWQRESIGRALVDHVPDIHERGCRDQAEWLGTAREEPGHELVVEDVLTPVCVPGS